MGEQVRHDLSAAEQANLAQQQQGSEESETEEEQAPGSGFLSYDHRGRVEDEPVQEQGDEEDDEAEEDTDPDDDESAEESEDERDESEDDEEPEEKPKKAKKTARERINELTRARREAERRAQEAEQRALEAEARQKPDDKEDLTPEKSSDTVKPDSGQPNPRDYEFGEIDSKYISDLVDWKTEQRLSAHEQKQEQRRQEQEAQQHKTALRQKWDNQVAKGAEKYDDFEEKVVLGALEGRFPLSNELGQMIIDSEVGADVAYQLASQPSEAERVYHMTPLEQARWFGTVESGLSSSRDAPKQTVKSTKAPEPVRRPRGSSGKFTTPADTDDFSKFEQMAQKELRNAR